MNLSIFAVKEREMSKVLNLIFIGVCLIAWISVSGESIPPDHPPPNIVLILADDLGYGELGCYGQQLIETPNIDLLAASGMKFTQYYSGSPVCAPARCILLTGLHSGHAQIRGNDEWKARGDVWDYLKMINDSTLEGQAPMKPGTVTLATLLREVGYSTAIIGKWGLGAPHTESIPTKLGFDYFFGYNCQRQAHTYYPRHLWENENRVYLDNKLIAPHTKLHPDADPYDLEQYADFSLNEYPPDLMLDAALTFIEKNKQHPFFLYFATPIPHVPLQAPAKWVDYYHHKFGDEKPYLGDQGYFPHRYPRAGYAALVSTLDDQVGLLIAKLKKLGIYENTLIIFTSDNGPSYAGGTDSQWFNSAGPFSSEKGRGKGSLHEGGIRVPYIASWSGHIPSASTSDVICCFQDLLPTLCEITGGKIPDTCDGISQTASMFDTKPGVGHPYLYWEFPEYGGQQAVRMGKWKAIRKEIKKGNMEIELYNLETDIREEFNLAELQPEIIQQVEQIFIQEHRKSSKPRFQMNTLD